MNYQQPTEMQSNVGLNQEDTTQTNIPEQNVGNDKPGQNVYVIPVIQSQEQCIAGQQPPAAHSQAQGMRSGTRSIRPTADQKAFMGTDTEGRFASHNEIAPGQLAKNLETEMKQKYKNRKKQKIAGPVKQVAIGRKSIDLQDQQ